MSRCKEIVMGLEARAWPVSSGQLDWLAASAFNARASGMGLNAIRQAIRQEASAQAKEGKTWRS